MTKTVNANRIDQAIQFDDALWSYKTILKTSIGAFPYQLMYGNVCYLPIKLEQKALWSLYRLNLAWSDVEKFRVEYFNEVDELGLKSYEDRPSTKRR